LQNAQYNFGLTAKNIAMCSFGLAEIAYGPHYFRRLVFISEFTYKYKPLLWMIKIEAEKEWLIGPSVFVERTRTSTLEGLAGVLSHSLKFTLKQP
jgi:hypothetical protein